MTRSTTKPHGAGRRGKLYPGQGDAWMDFLHHRMRLLAEWRDAGKPPEYAVSTLRMDPTQVRLILGHWDDYWAKRYATHTPKKRGKRNPG